MIAISKESESFLALSILFKSVIAFEFIANLI
ncbi:hypothetical protein CUP0286 [Campylobacter upsaliensis RM3195]|nr:hypothetical protein CUP0286 [Campylobacter upsaliensis RM3195]